MNYVLNGNPKVVYSQFHSPSTNNIDNVCVFICPNQNRDRSFWIPKSRDQIDKTIVIIWGCTTLYLMGGGGVHAGYAVKNSWACALRVTFQVSKYRQSLLFYLRPSKQSSLKFIIQWPPAMDIHFMNFMNSWIHNLRAWTPISWISWNSWIYDFRGYELLGWYNLAPIS